MLFKSEDCIYERWNKNSCIFGISHQNDPLPFIADIPIQTTSINTYFGEGNLEIIEKLIQYGINEHLEYLEIGFEHANAKYGYTDYSRISNLLSNARFPKLKSFNYGTDFLLINEDGYYPYLGDLTKVLENMPVLESLKLYGVFDLNERLSSKSLTEISINSYWVTDDNVGFISQNTLNNLLKSNFDILEDIEIDLNIFNFYINEEKCYYELDESLFQNFPCLTSLYICGYFTFGTIGRLSKTLLSTIQKLSLSDMREEETNFL